MTKPKKLSDDDFKRRVEDLLRASNGAVGTKASDDRIRNMDAYLAEPEGEWSAPEIDDRSALVATDVADVVEWMLPSLLRVFAASKDAIQVTPRRPQFEAQAAQVQATLRWLFWDKLDGVALLHDWIKDGLIQKVGFVRVGYTRSTLVTKEQYRGLTEPQAAMLVNDEAVEVLGQAERHEAGPDGQPIKVFDLNLQRSEPDGCCTVLNVPPEEMRIDSSARYGSEPKFIAQEYHRPRSELEAAGYDVAGIGSDDGIGTDSTEEFGRHSINTYTAATDDDDEDPALRVVEAYVRSGPPEAASWERALIVGDRLIERDEVDGHPYVWQCPAPMPHVFFGHCPADHALEPQRLRTRLLRAVEDNVYLTVNGRMGVVGGDPLTVDDLLDSRPGGLVRLRTAQDLVPIVQPDLSAAAWQAVEWGQQWSEQRTGFSRLAKGLSSEALNETATGVLEITERADMRVELIARHIAQAMGRLLTKVMECIAKHQDVAQTVQIAGQWVDVDPRDWANHYQVSVHVGLGSSNKDRQTAQLSQLQQIQAQMMAAGMVQPPAVVALARKLAETMGIEHPESYFPDPPPPQPPQPPLQIQIEQIKGQQAMQKSQVDAQVKLQEAQASLQLQASNDARDAERERHKAEMQAVLQQQAEQNKLAIAKMRADNDRYRSELEQSTRLQIAAIQQQAQAAPAVDLSGLARLEETMTALLAAVTAPKRVVRNPMTGRVEGVEVIAHAGPPPAAKSSIKH